MKPENVGELRRLPLWRTCLDEMRDQLQFGAKFPVLWLEDQLGCKNGSYEFGHAIRAINDELAFPLGFYLSSRDQNDEFFVIVDAQRAENVADCNITSSFRNIRRGINLFRGLLSNPDANLDDTQRRRIEGKAYRNSIRLALMQKPVQAFKNIPEQKKILPPDAGTNGAK